MASGQFDIAELDKRMRASLEALKRELSGLRTGRASTHLLDPIQVNVYGSKMPLNQVATISVPEPRTISVQVWDKSNVSAVDKAIREANLGINPVVDGALIRLPIPDADGGSASGARQARAQVCGACARCGPQRAPRGHGASEEARKGRQNEPGRAS